MKKKKREQMEQKKKKKLYAWQLGKSGSHIGSRSQLAGNIRSGKPILPSLPFLLFPRVHSEKKGDKDISSSSSSFSGVGCCYYSAQLLHTTTTLAG